MELCSSISRPAPKHAGRHMKSQKNKDRSITLAVSRRHGPKGKNITNFRMPRFASIHLRSTVQYVRSSWGDPRARCPPIHPLPSSGPEPVASVRDLILFLTLILSLSLSMSVSICLSSYSISLFISLCSSLSPLQSLSLSLFVSGFSLSSSRSVSTPLSLSLRLSQCLFLSMSLSSYIYIYLSLSRTPGLCLYL